MKTLALLVTAVISLSCGKILPLNKKKSQKEPGRLVLLHGDPMTLVTGTNLNQKSFLAESDIANFDVIHLGNWVSFRRETPADEVKEKESLEEGQEATQRTDEANKEDSETFTREDPWSFIKDADGSYLLGVQDKKIKFRFQKNQEGLLDLVAMEEIPVRMLHYSVNTQKNLLSFLFSYEKSPYGLMVTSVSFFKPGKEAFTLGDTDRTFNYLLGEGVKTQWNKKPLNLTLCGSINAKQKGFLNAINLEWVRNGKIGQREFSLSMTPQNTPFSDVNSQCILFAEGYEDSVTTQSFTGGITIPSLDPFSQMILDSDIMIFSKPFKKNFSDDPVYRDQLLKRTVLHEFGHWLGLDHEFDFDAKFQSIMSYETILNVQRYDLEAVEQLYGPYDR